MRFKQLYLFSGPLLLFLLFFLPVTSIYAQHDSLIFKNGNTVVGEIKSLDKGVLTIETDYSKSDFTIEWSGIKEIYSKTIFLVTFEDGRRANGSIQSLKGSDKVIIETAEGEKIETSLITVVFLKGLKSDFWSRLSATIDIGVSFSKANNLNQLSINSSLGYLARRWQLDEYYNMTNSSQDSVATTKRLDAGITYKYFLPKDWYLLASITFLSNTEQALKLRTTGKLGGGKFLVHSNRSYWGLGAGLSYNHETFSNGTDERNSVESYLGTELNLFDIGDLNLLSSLYIYPSLTESGRLRTDFSITSKYDLPLDFYIKLNLTWNYDNRPAVAGKETDYVLAFTIGWEL